MDRKKSPWSDPDFVRDDQSADPAVFDPKDQNEQPTHEQSNSPGNPKRRLPIEPYPDRSND
ncbi:hypothetical protein M8994_16390 [Brucella sp. 21LCYQ03]|nr:hypothetical protein [Brucella sp. 21LCYQ03]